MLYLNGLLIPVTMFPDNTSQIWKLPKECFTSDKNEIVWDFSNEAEFFQLAQLKELVHYENTSPKFETEMHLVIKYLPYGRQDKEISNNQTFALRVFASMLNGLDFDSVTIHDPHSSIALDLIFRSKAVYPVTTVKELFNNLESDLICFPDNGALNKYSAMYDLPFVYGEKVRDQSTGNITSYKLNGEVLHAKVLIVDDICDGGATFEILTKQLLEAGAKEVHLFVTHGVFSKGLKGLNNAGISSIHTNKGEASTFVQI